jgi:uncharacterized protein (TIGR02391 family)
MNLDTLIRADLWQEICTPYEASDYKNAIVNAVHVLTKVLREKTDSELDGYKLAGEALGGKNPKLKINNYQTQSEIDQQEGFAQIIMGLYKGIRNPRSHEIISDTKNDADAIIYFVDYIIKIIDKSNPTFTIEDFLKTVFDPDFVEKEEYAFELLNEIPKKKLFGTLVAIYRGRENGNSRKLAYMTSAIIEQLNSVDLKSFMEIVSDELQKATEDSSIISTLQMIHQDKLWDDVRKAPKMRIENKIINSIAEGEIIVSSDFPHLRDNKGVLGTWAAYGLLDHFSLRDEASKTLYKKLQDEDSEDNIYVLQYFLSDLPKLLKKQNQITTCMNTIHRIITNCPDVLLQKICDFLISCPENWWPIIKDTLSDLTNPDDPTLYLRDGTPLLGKEKNSEDEDEIPF